MPQKHDVIGLISGGKDSFLSLLHCLAQKHRIVALANLYPPGADPASELNSYMYQTVGHTIIPLYTTALRIPLYRGEIFGSARNTRRDYYPEASLITPLLMIPSDSSVTASFDDITIPDESEEKILDETESLIPLLRRIIAIHPTASAVCSGAILSTYQRTRIESVALRLNLTPLAYLWQYPVLPCPAPSESSLLHHLAAVGLEARIVKIASGGMNEEHLWLDLRDEESRKKVERGIDKFGGNVLGEGGEYETLVLDGPRDLFKGKILVEEEEKSIQRGEGGEAWLGFSGGKVIDKDDGDEGKECWEDLRVPDLWDMEFAGLPLKVKEKVETSQRPSGSRLQRGTVESVWNPKPVVTKSASTITFSNVVAPLPFSDSVSQISAIIDSIQPLLASHNLSTSSIVFTSLFLRSMSDFASINNVYADLFSQPLPPARVTIGCGKSLPRGINVIANFVMKASEETKKEGLHVQSRSYWAPANIGAYSQAIASGLYQVNDKDGEHDDEGKEDIALVYVAGQIPLVPATMEILSEDEEGETGSMHIGSHRLDSFCRQACLALQHLWRIGKSMRVEFWTGVTAFMVAEENHAQEKAHAAWVTWQLVHEQVIAEKEFLLEECVDIWDRKYGVAGSFAPEHEEACLPSFDKMKLYSGAALENSFVVGFFAVQVDELPRGCAIEWQALGVKNGALKVGVSAEEGIQICSSAFEATGNAIFYIGISMPDPDQRLENSILEALDQAQTTVQVNGGEKAWALCWQLTIYTPYMGLISGLDAQIVPCRAVWGPAVTELAAGIVLRFEKGV